MCFRKNGYHCEKFHQTVEKMYINVHAVIFIYIIVTLIQLCKFDIPSGEVFGRAEVHIIFIPLEIQPLGGNGKKFIQVMVNSGEYSRCSK